jgi:isoleucyl-tRNA synthetase
MAVLKSDHDVINYWRNTKSDETASFKDEAQICLFNSPVSLAHTPELDKLTSILISDTLYKYLQKKEIRSFNYIGFDAYNTSVENHSKSSGQENGMFSSRSGVFENIEDERVNTFQDKERLHDNCNYLVLRHERLWQNLLEKCGVTNDFSNTYNNSSRVFTEYVWENINKLWKQKIFSKQFNLSFYSPQLQVTVHPDTGSHDVVYNKEKQLTPVVKFFVSDSSKRKLTQRILRETEKQIEIQEQNKATLIDRMLEIRDTGNVGKKSKNNFFSSPEKNEAVASLKNEELENESLGKKTSKTSVFDIFKGSKDKESSLNWENIKSEGEFEKEVDSIKAQIETISDNINVLETVRSRIMVNAPISFLSWVQLPFTLPATVALAVNPESEYSMYYLENNNEFVILSENRAVPVISLQLDQSVLSSSSIRDVLDRQVDGGEYFESIGEKIHKVVSFIGKDLEGIEYEPIFDYTNEKKGFAPGENHQEGKLGSIWESFSWEEKSNSHKVYCHNDIDANSGTGINIVAPAYGFVDFQIRKERNLPLLFILDEQGCMYPELNSDLEIVGGLKYSEASDIIIGLLDKYRSVFATFVTTLQMPYFKTADKGGEQEDGWEEKYPLYVVADENWSLDEGFVRERIESMESSIRKRIRMRDYATLSATPVDENFKDEDYINTLKQANLITNLSVSNKRLWGIPLPIWKSEEGGFIFVKDVEDLLSQAINPIYVLLNHRDLNPKLYESGKIVIFTDKNTKLPLGINAIQYRSAVLTEMRKEKVLTLKTFSKYSEKIMEEIYQLFEKYPTIQIILDTTEQALFSGWLNGDNPDRTNIDKFFYFYKGVKKLSLEERMSLKNDRDLLPGGYVPTGETKIFKLQRPYIDEFILRDELNNIYIRLADILENELINGMLLSHLLPESLNIGSENNSKKLLFNIYTNKESSSWLIPNLIFGVGQKQKNIKSRYVKTLENAIENQEDNEKGLEQIMEEFGADAVRYYALRQKYTIYDQIVTEDSLKGDEDIPADKRIAKIYAQSYLPVSRILYIVQKYNEDLARLKMNEYYRYGSRNSYQHTLNNWFLAYTQKYCQQLQFFMDKFEFNKAIALYQEYLTEMDNFLIPHLQYMENQYSAETRLCLHESLTYFCNYSSALQPITCERIYSYVNPDRDGSILGLRLYENIELSPEQNQLLDRVSFFKDMTARIGEMRKKHNIKLRQPLYADIIDFEMDNHLTDLLLQSCNLVPANLNNLEGSIEILKTPFGDLKVDMVIHEDLAALGFGKEFEKSVVEYLRNQGYVSRNKTVSMNWQIFEPENEDLVQKVIKNVNWQKLNVEIKWVDNLDPIENDSFEVKDLTKIIVNLDQK